MQTSWSGHDPVCGQWRLDRTSDGFTLSADGLELLVPAADAVVVLRVGGWLRPTLAMRHARGGRTLRGLSRRRARELSMALRVAAALAPAVEYSRRLRALVADHWDRQVWLPHDAVARALDGRPAPPRLRGRQVRAQDRRWAPFLTDAELAALELLEWDVELWIHHTNERIVAGELSRHRDFFEEPTYRGAGARRLLPRRRVV